MKQETLKKSWAFYELRLVLSRKALHSIQRDLRSVLFCFVFPNDASKRTARERDINLHF